ncbi:hypothetical protein LMIY3S_04694 [Labrys miyagiensis]
MSRTELQDQIVEAMEAHGLTATYGASTRQVREAVWLSFGKSLSNQQVAQGLRRLVIRGDILRAAVQPHSWVLTARRIGKRC